MNIRTAKPEAGNKFYITKSKGGYSSCIQGNPMDMECDVLANCVGYACGRFNEIIGSMKYPLLNCNAENFIERAKNTYGLEISTVPTVGGIMVWQKVNTRGEIDGAGHVAIVEKIIDENTIYTSESSYGSSAFWNSIRRNYNGRWGLGNGYIFRGCIVNPTIGKIIKNNATMVNNQSSIHEITTSTVDMLELVKKTIRGDFGNGRDRREALGSCYEEVQRQVNLNLKNGNTNWDNIKLF